MNQKTFWKEIYPLSEDSKAFTMYLSFTDKKNIPVKLLKLLYGYGIDTMIATGNTTVFFGTVTETDVDYVVKQIKELGYVEIS